MEKGELMKQENLDNRWLEEIHDKMKDFQADAPADGWEKLESALFPKINFWHKNKWKAIAAMAVIFVGLGISLPKFVSTPQYTPKTITASQERQHIDGKNTIQQPQQRNTQNEIEEITEALKKRNNNFFVSKKENTTERDSTLNEDFIPSNEIEITELTFTEASEPNDSLYDRIKDLGDIEEKQLLAFLDNALLDNDDITPSDKNKHRAWSLGAIFGGKGILDFNNRDESNYSSPQDAPQPIDSTQTNTTTKAMTRAALDMPQDEDTTILDSKNHRSWSFGISAQKQISRNLAIESGLTYTLLTSDITIQKNRITKNESQSLHCIGIPLKVNYYFTTTQNWNFYAGAGAMLEYCIGGTRNGVSLTMSNRWQWSAKANLGVQYNFSKFVGIYLEPGVNYFISPNKTIPTLRTQQPFSFNLNAGLRFNIRTKK
ncbi:MAG: outer membrane beta-barrel protein [Bacteroidales bacterium]|nr:outer membrane beta-barrel protein [Bacteroidales bacterium]